MLQRNERLDADTRTQLEVIRRNAELEARLIDDLLDATRISRGKIELDKQHVELGTVIERAVEVCRPDIEARRLELKVDLGESPYHVDADARRLQQVFWNLLKNAVKFTPSGGRVGIRCRTESGVSGQLSVAEDNQHRTTDHVLVEVSDTGQGIERELLPKLFHAFEQGGAGTTRQFGGLGLGLAISKGIVEMHGGSITADSKGKGRGATFRVDTAAGERGIARAERERQQASATRTDCRTPPVKNPARGGPRRHGPDDAVDLA